MSDDEGPPAEDAAAIIQQLSRASACMDVAQSREAGLACEAGKETLLRGAKEFVRAALGVPVLTSKGSDGTPISVAYRGSRTMPGGAKKVRTQGRTGVEFLIANQFLRAHFHDGWKTRVVLEEAVPLTNGKKSLQSCRPRFAVGSRCDNLGIMARRSNTMCSIA